MALRATVVATGYHRQLGAAPRTAVCGPRGGKRMTILDRLKKARVLRAWVLEERNPVEGQIRAYRLGMTDAMRSGAVSPWITRFGRSTLGECQRKLDEYIDKSQLRIRNVETGETLTAPFDRSVNS